MYTGEPGCPYNLERSWGDTSSKGISRWFCSKGIPSGTLNTCVYPRRLFEEMYLEKY
jgi:hypothetical protein